MERLGRSRHPAGHVYSEGSPWGSSGRPHPENRSERCAVSLFIVLIPNVGGVNDSVERKSWKRVRPPAREK